MSPGVQHKGQAVTRETAIFEDQTLKRNSMDWAPICNYTHYSLLQGFSKPDELAKKCSENGYRACGITDYKSLSGAVSFYQACVKHNIKPIIGCAFDEFTLIAKNKDGWLNLIEIIALLDDDGNLPSTGCTNTNMIGSYAGRQAQDAFKIFDRGNLICIASKKYPALGQSSYVVSQALRPTYYTDKSDALLHRTLLCSSLKTTLPDIKRKIKNGEVPDHITRFFSNDTFFLPNKEEITEILLDECTHQQVSEVADIIDACEHYDILRKPSLPVFSCPGNQTEEEMLKALCRKGWKDLLISTNKVDDEDAKTIYTERFHNEIQVIKDANLFGYFLIVWDIVRFVGEQGWLSGPGRGSSAGCLISYLMGITKVDPIEYDLLFERFYNSSRINSLPDIDIDVPGKKRDEIIAYLKDKYGHDNVSQMITFGRLQGRSALKEVLRINKACSFGEMNEITKSLPNEADISDQLQEMDEEDRSIIRWALINNPEQLRDFCFINSRGELDGDYADFFDQAIRIEGTFKSQGKHPAGIVISKNQLKTVCPMVNQKSGNDKIAGLEMSDLESLGHVKFDVLGINLLDKLMKIQELRGIKNG